MNKLSYHLKSVALTLVSCFAFMGVSYADLNTMVSASGGYTPGGTSQVTVSVTISTTTTEWGDYFSFTFPAGFTATVASGPITMGTPACGDGVGNVCTTGNVVGIGLCGFPTGDSNCGPFYNDTYVFVFDVTAPMGASGSLNVAWIVYGDGWNCNGGCSCGNATCDTGTFPIGALVCSLECSGDVTVDNAPGECGAYVTLTPPIASEDCAGFEIGSVLLTENFDAATMPAGWTTAWTGGTPASLVPGTCSAAGTAYFMFGCASFPEGSPPPPPPGFSGFVAVLDDDNPGSGGAVGTGWLVSPTVSLAGAAGVNIKADYQFDQLGSASFVVEYWNGSSWTNAYVLNAEQSGALDLTILGISNADFQVRFGHNDGGGWNWGVAFDNVVLTSLVAAAPAATNNFNGGTEIVNAFFPIGETEVVWTILDDNGNEITCTQTVIVIDTEGPTLTCPANMEVTLLPGQCEAVLNYTITATDNCELNPPAGLVETINIGGNGNSAGGMVWFNINNLTGTNITVTELGMNISNATLVNIYLKAGTHVGFETNPGAWTLVDAADASTGPFSGPFPGNGAFTPVPTEFVVPPGLHGIALHTVSASSNYTNGTGANQFFTDGQIELILGSTANTAWGAPFTPRIFNGYVAYGTESNAGEIIQTSGLPSGSSFPVGTTTNCFQVEDIDGNIGTCCFDITVNEFPNPTSTLACNDHVNVSVDQNCEAFITTDMILEGGPYGCYDDYLVSVEGYGSGFGGVLLGSDAVGQTLVVTVTDPETGNSCWGTILIEDKLPPTIECRDITVICGEEIPFGPAPELSGYQTIVYEGLSDPLDIPGGSNIEYNYEFDFSYIPAGTPAIDIDVRFAATHTFTGDINVELIAPSGNRVWVFEVTGCGGPFPIDTWFDDEGVNPVDCNGLTMPRIFPIFNGGASIAPNLFNLDGEDVNGIWTVRVFDDFPVLDGGTITAVGVSILVELPELEPVDNCGEVELTYTETQSSDPCEGSTIIRTWTATDNSGNSASCEQTITIVPIELDEVEFPAAYFGDCDDYPFSLQPGSTTKYYPHPNQSGWPTVNGETLTDAAKLCNIFLDYWDQPFQNNCGGSYKIVRHWTIVDYCANETIEGIQVLTIQDNDGPVLSNYPANLQVGTDFWYCYANVNLPRPTAVDICGSDPITWSVTATNGVLVQFGNNYRLDQVPLGTTVVTWTATDACGNSSTASFTITVIDDVAPVAICDHHTIVSLTNDGPSGVTLVPAEVFDDGSYDNCGPVTLLVRRMDNPGGRCAPAGTSGQIPNWTTNGACIDDIAQPGNPTSPDFGTVFRPCVPFFCCDVPTPGTTNPITVVLQVTDGSGNVNECMVIAEVQDKIPPFVITPPDIIVSCDFWFHYVEGIYNDDVAANPAGNGDGSLDEDPLSGIFGNMYDAFRYDESVRQPIIINDPGNTSLPQPYNWGLDGWADDNCEVFLRVQVVATDGCNKATPLPAGAPNNAIKLIERRFQVRDAQGNQPPGALRQRIWVVDFDPFTITDTQCGLVNQDDVRWPCDITLTDCPIGGLTPDNLEEILPQAQRVNARPQLNEDYCNLLAVTYEDTRFDFVDGTCYKILREWTVVDWCQFDLQEGTGIWKYTQVISVIDNNPPQFIEPAETQVLCVNESEGVTLPDNNQIYLGEGNPNATSCSAHLHLKKRVRETCSHIVNYDVKLYLGNGTEYILLKQGTAPVDPETSEAELYFNTSENTTPLIIRQNGVPYNSPWCNDYHRLLWTVQDGCGRENTHEYLIRLEDCKAPTPVCINGLSTVVMPKNGEVTIWAKDFNASSFDDCTPAADLLYSFSGDTYQPSMTYTCDNIPAFGVELAVQIWVADGGTDDNCNGQISWGERNKDFCTTTIVILDNTGVCSDTTGSVLGEIITEDVQSVELVNVSLNVPGQIFPTYVTTENGRYNFAHVIIPQQFTIEAKRNDNHKNGVNTLDLIEIQKHLLGIKALSSPYDIIAADANNSGSISAVDLVELRRLILGIYNELPSNQSWRFVNKSFDFADESNPWPFEEVISMDAMMGGVAADKDFVAIKVGDVNNTVQANARQVLPRNGGKTVTFTAEDREVSAGELVSLTVSSADFTGIEGYQFTLELNGVAFRGVASGAVKMTEEHLGVFDGMITASWNDASGKAVSAGTSEALFTLQFEAVQSGKLSEMVKLSSKVTEAGAFAAGETMDLGLTFRGNTDAEFALYQNEPNPVRGMTIIGYDVPVSGNVTLTVFDVTGKVVVVKEAEAVSGYNTITVSTSELGSAGVLYYRLDAGEYTATKKMVVID